MKKAAEQPGVSLNTLSSWRRAKKKMGEGKTFVLSAREKELQKENEELKKTLTILSELAELERKLKRCIGHRSHLELALKIADFAVANSLSLSL